jgi:predicted membrane metal-binding protein
MDAAEEGSRGVLENGGAPSDAEGAQAGPPDDDRPQTAPPDASAPHPPPGARDPRIPKSGVPLAPARPGSLGRRPWQVAAACLALGLALAPVGLGVALAAGAVVAGGLTVVRARQLAGLALLLVVGGALVGELRLAAIDSLSERVEDGRSLRLTAYLVSRPRPSAFGASAEITVADGPLHGARLLLRLPRWVEAPPADIGAELTLAGRLRTLDDGAAGPRSLDNDEPGPLSFDWAAHLRRRGIAGEYLADRVRLTGRRRGGLAGALDRMRERAERAVGAGLTSADGALARGMVLGQDEDIDEAVRQDFRDSGLAHLLAVSGQNVMCSPLWPCRSSPRPAWVRAGAGSRCWPSSPCTCPLPARDPRFSVPG